MGAPGSMGVGIVKNSTDGARFEPKRAFRWWFEVTPPANNGIGTVIKTNAMSFGRPQMTFEKIEMHHLNTKYFLRGKGEWQDMTLVLYDGETSAYNAGKAIYQWMQAIYDPSTDIMLPEVSVKAENSLLSMLNGAGEVTEEWTGYGIAPTDCNWNSEALDYTSSESAKVEMTLSCDKWVMSKGV